MGAHGRRLRRSIANLKRGAYGDRFSALTLLGASAVWAAWSLQIIGGWLFAVILVGTMAACGYYTVFKTRYAAKPRYTVGLLIVANLVGAVIAGGIHLHAW